MKVEDRLENQNTNKLQVGGPYWCVNAIAVAVTRFQAVVRPKTTQCPGTEMYVAREL